MSLIVAVRGYNGMITMGHDTAVITDEPEAYFQTSRAGKMQPFGDVMIGYVGDVRIANIMETFFKLDYDVKKFIAIQSKTDAQERSTSPHAPWLEQRDFIRMYVIKHVCSCIRAALKDGHYERTERTNLRNAQFIVGVNGRVFTISENFAVVESSRNFDAIGAHAAAAYAILMYADDDGMLEYKHEREVTSVVRRVINAVSSISANVKTAPSAPMIIGHVMPLDFSDFFIPMRQHDSSIAGVSQTGKLVYPPYEPPAEINVDVPVDNPDEVNDPDDEVEPNLLG